MNIPCKNCICLPICKSKVQDWFPFIRTGVLCLSVECKLIGPFPYKELLNFFTPREKIHNETSL